MRRGVWGARVFMLLFATECPPKDLLDCRDWPSLLQRKWGALSRKLLLIHTRPPNPPAHGDRRPQRYHSAHSDLEVFITPPQTPGSGWPSRGG